MGAGIFTMFKIDHALDGRTLFSGNWSSDDSVFRDDSRGKCQIFPVDFPACHHGREERGTVKMPGNDQKTGGVPVKPVNAAVYKRLAFLFENTMHRHWQVCCHNFPGKGELAFRQVY